VQKISTLAPWKVFVLHPLSPRNFASKILAVKIPLPLGIPDDLPWGGYGFFHELYFSGVSFQP